MVLDDRPGLAKNVLPLREKVLLDDSRELSAKRFTKRIIRGASERVRIWERLQNPHNRSRTDPVRLIQCQYVRCLVLGQHHSVLPRNAPITRLQPSFDFNISRQALDTLPCVITSSSMIVEIGRAHV